MRQIYAEFFKKATVKYKKADKDSGFHYPCPLERDNRIISVKQFFDPQVIKDYKESKKTKKFYCIDCGKEISKNAQRCVECAKIFQRKVERPNRKELKDLIRNNSFTELSRKFGVSDNSSRKWCKTEG